MDQLFRKFVDKFKENGLKAEIPMELRETDYIYMCAKSKRLGFSIIWLYVSPYPSLMMSDRNKDSIFNSIAEMRSDLDIFSKKTRFEISVPGTSWRQIHESEARRLLDERQGCILRVSREKIDMLVDISD